MKIRISLILCAGLLISSCYVSKKVSREVTVSVNSDFPVVIDKDPKGHFLDYYTTEQYKAQFLDGLTKTLGYKNIKVVTENPEFIIQIEKITLQEKLSTDTVKDTKSPDFGKVYDITTGIVKSYCKITSADGSKSESFSADKTNKEKLTNIFRPGEKINGHDPGPNDWRKKAFDSHEFRDMAYKVGDRSGDMATNRINRFIK